MPMRCVEHTDTGGTTSTEENQHITKDKLGGSERREKWNSKEVMFILIIIYDKSKNSSAGNNWRGEMPGY